MNLKEVDLRAVLLVIQEVANETRINFESRFEARPPATCLVIEGPQPETARVIISAIEPGTLYIDIGVGLHGEWLLRNDADLKNAMEALRQLIAGVFRGEVVEDVRQKRRGRLLIRGSITTESKTFKFTHRAVKIPNRFTGKRQYSPYPSAAE
jgi:hypothetical protein